VEANKNVILVTGCSGRLGTRALERFGQQYTVVGFDIVEPKVKYPNCEYMYMDLSSDESVQKGFNQVREKYGNHIVSVIHLAAYYSFSGGHPELYDKITVKGTGRILKALKEFECEQFLFSSTQLVHATCEVGETINEDSPVIPKWDYPISKVKTEKLIHNERGNIPSVILRIAGCYDNECHSIPISNQIQRIYEHQFASRVFPGDITHGAPFLHMDDLTDCIWKAVEMRGQLPPEVVLLIGEDKTLSYDQLQRLISRLVDGQEISTIRVPKWFAKFGAWVQGHTPFMDPPFIKPWMVDLADDNYTLDITKARQMLGWDTKYFIGDVLPKMIQDLKADPIKWYETNGLKMTEGMRRKIESERGHAK